MAFKETPFHKMIQQQEAERLEFLRSCDPASTFGQLAELPIIHRAYPMGFVLRSPLTPHMVYVPFQKNGEHWGCIVVDQSIPDSPYPVGCCISVSNDEVIRSARVDLSL